jgi:hypothetical protein
VVAPNDWRGLWVAVEAGKLSHVEACELARLWTAGAAS